MQSLNISFLRAYIGAESGRDKRFLYKIKQYHTVIRDRLWKSLKLMTLSHCRLAIQHLISHNIFLP